MEANQSVLHAVRRGDWMVSIDLKDAYLQVPVYPDSRKFLCFVINGMAYQFKALGFGLSMAPQVFTMVIAPVSGMLHDLSIWILRYLDDWLLLASSRAEVLTLCHQLGIVINLKKSFLNLTQTATYLGMVIVSPSSRAFPSPERVSTLLSQITKFLSYRQLNVVASWVACPPCVIWFRGVTFACGLSC